MGSGGGGSNRTTTIGFVTTNRTGRVTRGGATGVQGFRALRVSNGSRGTGARTRNVLLATPAAMRRANAAGALGQQVMSTLRGVRSRAATKLRKLAREALA